MKVLSVFGTRPEAIKMAPVVKCLEGHEEIESYVCVTGQHRQMLDQVLSLFNIKPDFDLEIMKHNQSLSYLTSSVLNGIESILSRENYDWLLVQGDTTTVMAASLAAFYQGISIGHVEAGLRTYDKYHPFPEEMNRRIVDTVADLLFAPTSQAKANLLRENIDASKIIVTGNTIVDALKFILEHSTVQYDEWGIDEDARLILVTAHRRENWGEPLNQICHALRDLAFTHPDVQFLYPVHYNPNVRSVVYRELQGIPNVILTDPLDYQNFVYWLKRAALVLTDSGGVQEEAATLGKPLLIMRNATERPEVFNSQVTKLVGTDRSLIVQEVNQLLENSDDVVDREFFMGIFGDGDASCRIVEALFEHTT